MPKTYTDYQYKLAEVLEDIFAVRQGLAEGEDFHDGTMGLVYAIMEAGGTSSGDKVLQELSEVITQALELWKQRFPEGA